MKEIQQQTKKDDMQMHIDMAFKVIDEHIPTQYVEKVLEMLPKDTSVTKHLIRNVRRRLQKPERNLEVFTALYQVCVNEKEAKERFIKTLKN